MDKSVGKLFTQAMGKGEKQAPVKSIKVKVKFQKPKSMKKRKQDPYGAHILKTKKYKKVNSRNRVPTESFTEKPQRRADNIVSALKAKPRGNNKTVTYPKSYKQWGKNGKVYPKDFPKKPTNASGITSASGVKNLKVGAKVRVNVSNSGSASRLRKRKSLLTRMKKFKKGSGKAYKLFQNSLKKPNPFAKK